MLFPLWKLVNQLQKQFPYTVWFYCVWPGHLISISSCWEQRVNFISSFSFMQTARKTSQGQLDRSLTWIEVYREWRNLSAALTASLSAQNRRKTRDIFPNKNDCKLFFLGLFSSEADIVVFLLSFCREILQTHAQIKFKQNKCLIEKKDLMCKHIEIKD